MKNNEIERYFKQKKWGVSDFIALALVIAAGIFSSFITGSGLIGVLLLSVSLIVFGIIKSSKVKDAVIDDFTEKLAKDNIVIPDNYIRFQNYDPKAEYVKTGKDGVYRSNIAYCVSYDPKHKNHLLVYRLNLITSDVDRFELDFDKDHCVIRNEKVCINGITKEWVYLGDSAETLFVPIDPLDSIQYALIDFSESEE